MLMEHCCLFHPLTSNQHAVFLDQAHTDFICGVPVCLFVCVCVRVCTRAQAHVSLSALCVSSVCMHLREVCLYCL